MSRAAILLGYGHPMGDETGRTLLDVHLHPDCPDGPLSLGERSGMAPDVGAQFTLQAAAEREAEHLRLCGCEWLLILAEAERLRGQVFSPQEILEINPEWKPPPAVRPTPTPLPAMDTLEMIRIAIEKTDYEALERLRDRLTEDVVKKVASRWSAALPWKKKDAFAALLQDQTSACVQPIFRDALHSPTVETRTYALCVVTGDFDQFTELLTDGWVDETKVDAAIRAAGLA